MERDNGSTGQFIENINNIGRLQPDSGKSQKRFTVLLPGEDELRQSENPMQEKNDEEIF